MSQTRSDGGEPLHKKLRVDLSPALVSHSSAMEEDAETDFAMNEDELATFMSCSPANTSSVPDITSPVTPSHSSSQSPRDSWKRPPSPNIDPTLDPLVFQQIDIDFYTGGVLPNMPGVQRGPVPILRMFGVTDEGNSVCAHVHGFLPYFFVPAPRDFCDEHCRIFHQELDKAILDDMRSNRDNIQEAVLAVEMCRKCSIYGFYFNEMTSFLRITLSLPKLVAPARRLISNISIPPFGQIHYQVYTCNKTQFNDT